MSLSNWHINIASTNLNISFDSNSEALVSELDESITFIKIPILAADPAFVPAEDTEERMGGVKSDARGIREVFKLKLAPFVFPDDFTNYKAIWNLFKKRNKLISFENVNSDEEFNAYPVTIHSSGKCLVVVVPSISIDHNHDNGTKEMTIEVEKKQVSY